ncbi:MAG: hypothetical protein RSB67_01445 [Clostridia bacterium]
MKANKKGISLIVLVITIIVIIILAAAVILSFNNGNNPIAKAGDAVTANDKAEVKSALSLYLASKQAEAADYKSLLEGKTHVYISDKKTDALPADLIASGIVVLRVEWSEIGLPEMKGKVATYTVVDGSLTITK